MYRSAYPDLREYVGLQLRFAEAMAGRTGRAIDDCVLHYTNIHRRLGLGTPGAGGGEPGWAEFAAPLAELSAEARIDYCATALADAADGSAILLPGRVAFGCFACEPPNAEGMVRLHFGLREHGLEVGPLHHTRIAARRAELTAMIDWLSREHGETVRRIDGGSWLYNIEAYRRLFPPAFAASRVEGNGPRYLHGLSTWGQFIDHRGVVRPEIREAFLAALPGLDIAAPHRVFPLQVLYTSAPFDVFLAEYAS